MQFAEPEVGSPSMKSMVTICQAPSGVGSGCRSPGYLTRSGFDYWHIRQVWTNTFM